VYVIKRLDTGVVDVLTSLSATAPTMPANYTLFRRIGSLKTNGSFQWIKFSQKGNEFLWDVAVEDGNGFTLTSTATLLTISTPLGVQTRTMGNFYTNPGTTTYYLITSPDIADTLPANTNFVAASTAAAVAGTFDDTVRTNTSSQIRLRASASATPCYWFTRGWLDDRL